MNLTRMTVLTCACLALAAASVRAADPARGLVLTIERLDREGGVVATDSRTARLVALYAPAGVSTTPFLEPGPFRATWEGFLEVDLLDDYTFSAVGRGALELEVGGETVFRAAQGDLAATPPKTVELDGGRHRIRARYTSPTGGDAFVRLLWASFDFAAEPINPAVLTHDPETAGLRERMLVRRGREVVASRRCVRCHATSIDIAGGMPELDLGAPSLEGSSDRLDGAWLARWIADPRSLRHDASMPRVFAPSADGAIDPRALDVAAHLATLRSTPEGPPGDGATRSAGPASEDSARGEELFDSLGCIACHVFEPVSSQRPDPRGRVSLALVRAKWRPAALVEFLLDPDRHHPAIAMPDFGLDAGEARALAAHVLASARGKIEPVDLSAADPVRGKRLLEESGCLSCHAIGPRPVRVAVPAVGTGTPPLASALRPGATSGCLATGAADRGRAPDFDLDHEELAAVRSLAATGLASLARRCEPEYAERRIAALRCTACHRRDGRLDTWSMLAGDGEAGGDLERPRIPPGLPGAGGEGEAVLQIRPRLTWVGEKFRPEWLATFLAGGVEGRVRPWLEARMPHFAELAIHGDSMARGLALAHGFPPVSTALAPVDEKLAAIGEELLVQGGGFSCLTCHDRGAQKATGAFDAKGPNLDGFHERLRKDFYHRFMSDPQRIDPGTKMPQFAIEGRTPLLDFFGGDARRQFEAIWECLR